MKVILNEKDLLEQELEQAKNIVKSKTLTKDFIEKLDKCKTEEKLRIVFFEIDSKLKELTGKDVETLIEKFFEKQEQNFDFNYYFQDNENHDKFHKEFLEKSKILTKDFIKKIDKCKTIDELEATSNLIVSKLEDLEYMGRDDNILFSLIDKKIRVINKDILNKKEFLEKSKTLTKDFIKKINKCKDEDELSDVFYVVRLKFQNLTNKDKETLGNLFEKKYKIFNYCN